MKNIILANKNSAQKINDLRSILSTDDDSFTIVVVGSLARGEASDESDIDYYFFGDDDASVEKAKDFLISKQAEIATIVGKAPSADGAFGPTACETLPKLITDIGGDNDSNSKITRRILFLLEGTWLTSKKTFDRYREEVLARYVSNLIEDDHLCRFLLNDVIRYYRTICVDFEFKTFEKNKEWGLRYIKLRFSRQFLYFSGIVAIAETVGMPSKEKIEKLVELLNLSPIERVQLVCGNFAADAIDLYDSFLCEISRGEIRSEFNTVTHSKKTHTPNFKRMQSGGRNFTISLVKIIREKYALNHPIHNALIF